MRRASSVDVIKRTSGLATFFCFFALVACSYSKTKKRSPRKCCRLSAPFWGLLLLGYEDVLSRGFHSLPYQLVMGIDKVHNLVVVWGVLVAHATALYHL